MTSTLVKRGSETANEEQPDKLRKVVRFEQDAPNIYLKNTLGVVRDKTDQSQHLCRIQVMLTMTYPCLRWMYSTRWMDGRVVAFKKCWIGIEKKMPEISD